MGGGLRALLWLLALVVAAVAGQRFWELETGSRIAWVRVPAQGPRRRPTPVVFLHGGPGIADMAGDTAYFGQLAGDGSVPADYEGPR